MTSTRRFTASDLFKFNHVNLDRLTETYNLNFYFTYLSTWPEYFLCAESPNERTIMGYVMGKVEGTGELWHGHVTALTVGPDYRRLGLANYLMNLLETISENIQSNKVAIQMYKQFGYIIFRTVLGYYSGEEDAYDMRRALPRDKEKKSVIPLKRPIKPEELEWG